MGRNKRNDKQREERLGETKINNQGLEMKITEYNNNSDITVTFKDGYVRKTSYAEYKNGSVKNLNYKAKRRMPLKEERMSKIVINNEGYPMHLVEYNKAKDVTVEFLDQYRARVHTNYGFFEKGQVRNPNRIGAYGERIGNESPVRENGKVLKVYDTWRNILFRTKGLDEHSKKYYSDVSMSKEWLYYTNFYNWATNEENYERWNQNEGGLWAIDKDILSDPNNRMYSPETCCLVPPYINSIVVRQQQKDRKSKYPLGIQYYPYGENGKYFYNTRDKILNPNKKRVNIYFDTVEEAVAGYKEYKYSLLYEVAEYAYKKGDISKKCYEGLMNYDLFAYEDLQQ